MFEIKKHSLLDVISLILAIVIIIIFTIEFVMVVIIPRDWYIANEIVMPLEITFFLLFFLTIITTVVGLITILVKRDSFGMKAIFIGILFFILNWIIILFVISKMRF